MFSIDKSLKKILHTSSAKKTPPTLPVGLKNLSAFNFPKFSMFRSGGKITPYMLATRPKYTKVRDKPFWDKEKQILLPRKPASELTPEEKQLIMILSIKKRQREKEREEMRRKEEIGNINLKASLLRDKWTDEEKKEWEEDNKKKSGGKIFKDLVKPRYPGREGFNVVWKRTSDVLRKHREVEPYNDITNPRNEIGNRLENAREFISNKRYMEEGWGSDNRLGFEPTLVNERGSISDGRHRLLALKQLGYSWIPVEEFKDNRSGGKISRIYNYQDNNQERVIHHPTWNKGNSYRFILEGTGDIFRELTKEQPHSSYIDEKKARIAKYIEEKEKWIHPEDDYPYSYEHNKDKYEMMIKQWEKQPYKTEVQKKAIDLNLAMLKGDTTTAKKLLDDIDNYKGGG